MDVNFNFIESNFVINTENTILTYLKKRYSYNNIILKLINRLKSGDL